MRRFRAYETACRPEEWDLVSLHVILFRYFGSTRFQVLTAVVLKALFYWNVTQCRRVSADTSPLR